MGKAFFKVKFGFIYLFFHFLFVGLGKLNFPEETYLDVLCLTICRALKLIRVTVLVRVEIYWDLCAC